MGYIPPTPPNWRLDSGLSSIIRYKKRFAIFPIKCSDGTRAWLKFYYSKYELWSHANVGMNFDDDEYLHEDFIERLSEADYIVERLIGST